MPLPFFRRGPFVLFAVAVAATSAASGASAFSPTSTAPALSTPQLEAIRGGFSVDGVDFNFGAEIRTLVDGKLALQTNLVWTTKGAVITTGAGASAVLDPAGGVSVTDPSGVTTVLQKIDPNHIANIVVNTASNRTISQQIQLNLDVPNLSQLQANFARQQTALRLEQGMAGAALYSIGH